MARLAGALVADNWCREPQAREMAAVLMPVVDAIARQRAAEELEAAADAMDDRDWQGQQYGTHPVTRLRDRAIALRGPHA